VAGVPKRHGFLIALGRLIHLVTVVLKRLSQNVYTIKKIAFRRVYDIVHNASNDIQALNRVSKRWVTNKIPVRHTGNQMQCLRIVASPHLAVVALPLSRRRCCIAVVVSLFLRRRCHVSAVASPLSRRCRHVTIVASLPSRRHCCIAAVASSLSPSSLSRCRIPVVAHHRIAVVMSLHRHVIASLWCCVAVL